MEPKVGIIWVSGKTGKDNVEGALFISHLLLALILFRMLPLQKDLFCSSVDLMIRKWSPAAPKFTCTILPYGYSCILTLSHRHSSSAKGVGVAWYQYSNKEPTSYLEGDVLGRKGHHTIHLQEGVHMVHSGHLNDIIPVSLFGVNIYLNQYLTAINHIKYVTSIFLSNTI